MSPSLATRRTACSASRGGQAAGFGGARARGEAGVDRRYRTRGTPRPLLPRHLERDLHGLVDAQLLDVEHRDDRGVALVRRPRRRGGCRPAPDADLDEVRGRHVGEVGGMGPVGGVHAFVHGRDGGVDVAVEMDDAQSFRPRAWPALWRRGSRCCRYSPMMTGKAPASRMWEMAKSIWSKVFSMLAGITKISPASPMVISSRRSMPRSGL